MCTGALLLAEAGLLDGYEATTHWGSCDALAAHHPGVRVLPDRIYVHDRDRWTSAGVTAGVDLFLALVEADHGSAIAHEAAGGSSCSFSAPAVSRSSAPSSAPDRATTTSIADLQAWLGDHLDENLAVDALAARTGMSPRTFARAFRRDRHDAGRVRRGAPRRDRAAAARDNRTHRSGRRRWRGHEARRDAAPSIPSPPRHDT